MVIQLSGFIYGLSSRESWVQMPSRTSEFLKFICKLLYEIYHVLQVMENFARKPAELANLFNYICEVPNPHWGPRGNCSPCYSEKSTSQSRNGRYVGWHDDDYIDNWAIIVIISRWNNYTGIIITASSKWYNFSHLRPYDNQIRINVCQCL